MDTKPNTLTVNNVEIAIEGERNLLEVIRKAGIDLPTFCYHSELSIYGACRLCLVEIVGKGVTAACSTAPRAGMVIKTETAQLRNMRKINIELLLANHKRECPSCTRSHNCNLQDIARRLGVSEVRYKQSEKMLPIDNSSDSLVRDPNKCVLCGDCVRVCSEIQSVGAIDFAFRGAKARVVPAFDQNLNEVECVNCGQCAAVCPTGAIVPKADYDDVWEELNNPDKVVVAQIAPAVRVALGEYFGCPVGTNVEGQMIAALRLMGFDYVYDTCFSADMTIFEEATELLDRIQNGGKLPMFTSCCPAWVKFAETYFPEMLPHLSSTRSPQQIFGAVARQTLPAKLGIKPENLVIVSIMPCVAKKFEAKLDKFKREGRRDVDHVVSTVGLAQMIKSMGINMMSLAPESFDMPLGFSTGGGVIFGATGGVMEAALRYAVEKLEGKPLAKVDFKEVRGMDYLREATYNVAGKEVKVAVVHTLAAARKLIEKIKANEVEYQFVEVMSCPGGCIAGGGQPINTTPGFRQQRAAGLYSADKSRRLQKSQDNFMVEKCYQENFGGAPGSHEAHEALHTYYQNRGQIFDARQEVLTGSAEKKLPICVTICTKQEDCKSQKLLSELVGFVKANGISEQVDISAAFSSRPQLKDTIGITIGSWAPENEDCSVETLGKVILEEVKAL
ncbi:MAG: 4Fe-4S dicluster domain-containing protein [Lentisphaerae bacterium]|nr:4Fe-4S dicluster domain-containing protein [Lentisphaerota bacterium]